MPKKASSEEPRENTAKKEKPKKGKRLLILLIILVVLGGSSAGAYLYFRNSGGEAAPVKKKVTEVETAEMGEMVVNLAGNGGGRYLKVKITLEYPKEKKLSAEIEKKKYLVTDLLIVTLRSKTFTEVISVGSVDKLKEDLIREINNHLEHGEITGVYFTDFLVQ